MLQYANSSFAPPSNHRRHLFVRSRKPEETLLEFGKVNHDKCGAVKSEICICKISILYARRHRC
jgi:hypothetical protein